jgi:hypothetical protein
MLTVTVLVNSVWLSNFIFGASDLSTISAEATRASFKALNSTSLANIFSGFFSNATLISKYYSHLELLLTSAIIFTGIASFAILKHKARIHIMMVILLAILIFLATGLFQSIQIPIISKIYPMFREVGHFAPVIILVSILMSAMSLPKKYLPIFVVLCMAAISVSSYKFITYANAISFSDMRNRFSEFEKLSPKVNTSPTPGRVLAYPFFDQYSIFGYDTRANGVFPLSNSGHDSYLAYSKFDSVKSAVSPSDFKNSIQNRFLKSYDVDLLQPYDIKYIFDFSEIYESNYNLFVPNTTYDSDLSLIKNDPDFMQKILTKNGDKVRQISDNVIEVRDRTSRVEISSDLYRLDKNTNMDDARSLYRNINGKNVNITSDKQAATSGVIANLFNNIADDDFIDAKNNQIQQKIDVTNEIRQKLYIDNTLYDLYYLRSEDGIQLEGRSLTGLQIDRKQVTNQNKLNVATVPTSSNLSYILLINGKAFQLKNTESYAKITTVDSDDKIELFELSKHNLLSNGSFESGLWQDKVGNCNSYDNLGFVSMSLDNNNLYGGNMLTLDAVRHNACSATSINIASEGKYLLEYEALSNENSTAGYHLSFGNSKSTTGRSFTSPDKWTKAARLIDVPKNRKITQLFLYSYGRDDDSKISTSYDNVRFSHLNKLQDIKIPTTNKKYTPIDLRSKAGQQVFTYSDDEYSLENIIPNGDFSEGNWRSQVDDCSNYDNAPKISMSSKRGSLVLAATRHTACTYQTVNIDADSTYLLKFKYRTEHGLAGFNVGLNDINNTQDGEQLRGDGDKWQTFSTKLSTNTDTSALTLHLYAYELDKLTENRVEYDDIELIKIPAVASSYYVVSDSEIKNMNKEATLSYDSISLTKRGLKISNISKPFYVNLKERYSPGWILHPTNDSAYKLTDHMKVNNYSNGWYVEPHTICISNPSSCKTNPDGTYNIDFTLYFGPQKWFSVTTWISIVCIMISVGVIGYPYLRQQKK